MLLHHHGGSCTAVSACFPLAAFFLCGRLPHRAPLVLPARSRADRTTMLLSRHQRTNSARAPARNARNARKRNPRRGTRKVIVQKPRVFWQNPIATVAVDLDSNPPLGALFTLVLFPSQVQLEARSTSLVETFSSRAERRGLSRFPPSSCRARARISTYVTQHAILSVIGREPDLRPSYSHVCNFNGTRQSIALVASARRRARARACHWRFLAPSPREASRVITRAHMRSTRQPRRRRRSRRIRNQDRDHNGHDQLSVLSLPNPFPKLTARAITGTKPTRHSDGRGRGGAAHGGGGGDRRSHGGAVACAMWQRRVTGRLQTITTERNDSAKARYFSSLLLGYAGGGGGEGR